MHARRPASSGEVLASAAQEGARPRQSAAESVLRSLQRTAGNRAVARLLDSEERRTGHDVVTSGGSALPAGIRAEMEARLGHDFSGVRVHTDARADASARQVQAHAYTSGSHVVFQQGQFDTSSHAGKTMLAHELTHVIQQRQGPVDGTPTAQGISLSDPSDRFERAAAANADRVMAIPLAQEQE